MIALLGRLVLGRLERGRLLLDLRRLTLFRSTPFLLAEPGRLPVGCGAECNAMSNFNSSIRRRDNSMRCCAAQPPSAARLLIPAAMFLLAKALLAKAQFGKI